MSGIVASILVAVITGIYILLMGYFLFQLFETARIAIPYMWEVFLIDSAYEGYMFIKSCIALFDTDAEKPVDYREAEVEEEKAFLKRRLNLDNRDNR